MVPDELESYVGEDSHQGHEDEAEEHLAHGQDGGLVDDVLFGPFVDELQHLVGFHLSVARGDRPLVLLQVQSLLHLAHHRHVRL